jgi:hypothetical protein
VFFTAATLAIYHFRIDEKPGSVEPSHGFVKGNMLANFVDEFLWKRLVAAPDGVREFIDRRTAKTAIHLDERGLSRYSLMITSNFIETIFTVPAVFVAPIIFCPKCP